MDSKKQIKFIINPISGGVRIIPIKQAIEYFIDRNKYNYTFVTTTKQGDAEHYARLFAHQGDTDIVVAVGGDGTVNEVGRGLIGSNTALGIIPCGSGNGLARHLGISTDPLHYIKWLNRCKIVEMDYGSLNGHPFFCTCGIGFDAEVSKRFADSKTRGVITYVEKILQEALTHKDESLYINIGNESEEVEAFILTCANAGQWGNNVYIAPQASVSDGWLDVTILTPFSAMDIPLLAYHLFNRQIDKNKKIISHRCTSLSIKRNSKGYAHIDGEPIEVEKDINIEIIPKGLKVAVPSKNRRI